MQRKSCMFFMRSGLSHMQFIVKCRSLKYLALFIKIHQNFQSALLPLYLTCESLKTSIIYFVKTCYVADFNSFQYALNTSLYVCALSISISFLNKLGNIQNTLLFNENQCLIINRALHTVFVILKSVSYACTLNIQKQKGISGKLCDQFVFLKWKKLTPTKLHHIQIVCIFQ